MPSYRAKLTEVLSRVNTARNAARAFRLAAAAETRAQPEICWADLMKTIEVLLPTTDEEAALLDELPVPPAATGYGTSGNTALAGPSRTA